MTDRDYDVVLLGASGFTGRLTAYHLARRLGASTARWAIAGRSPDKLRALVEELPGEGPAVEVVDIEDDSALQALARRTAVLATAVGPFVRYGEPVVAACVRAGTDYCDIAGEPAFVQRVRERYDADARAAGVRLVSSCGFDSVPHDLGVRFTVSRLPDEGHTRVRGYVHARGRLSGGTLRTAVDAVASRDTGLAGALRPVDGEPARREVSSLPRRIHRVEALGAYGVPMPTVDPAVVLRSARVLEGYGTSFSYGHYAQVGSLPAALASVAGGSTFAALAALPPSRALLRRLLPSSGEGPSEAARDRSWFQVTFLAHGGGQRVVTRVRGGDPGYGETAKMLGEAALSLAQDGRNEHTGALTPAVALGEHYQARLERQGIVFEVLAAPEPAEAD